MNCKFVLAVLLIFYIGQVFPATAPETQSHSYTLTRSAINDIINQLNILISQTGQKLSELSELIYELDRRISLIVRAVDLPGTLYDLWNQVKTIIHDAGITNEHAAGCISQGRKAASSMSVSVTTRLNQCLQMVDPAKNHIVEQIAEIRADGGDIITSISEGIIRSYRTYPSSPPDLLASLRPLQIQAIEQTNKLMARISAVLTDDKARISQMAEQLELCVRIVQQEATHWQQGILQDFRLCLAN